MFRAVVLVFAALVLLASLAFAVPEAPYALGAEFRSGGIFISWQHQGGEGVSFRVQRGLIGSQLKDLAILGGNNYLDSAVEPGKEYEYAITAFDQSGESQIAGFTVTNPAAEEKPFAISLVEPKQKAFGFGEVVEFVVRVESQRFNELQNLGVVLVNQLGETKPFSFDSGRNAFVLSEKLPEAIPGSGEGFSAAYSIRASASLGGEQFSESESYVLAMVPMKEIDIWQLALNVLAVFGLPFLMLMVASTIAFGGWKWSLQRKSVIDRLKMERLEAENERHLWRREVFKRRVTPEQFREKESELQSRLAAINEKLGGHKKGSHARENPFQGFTPDEAREVMLLVRTIRKPERGQTLDAMRARLVGLGKSERVAKKVAELIFESN